MHIILHIIIYVFLSFVEKNTENEELPVWAIIGLMVLGILSNIPVFAAIGLVSSQTHVITVVHAYKLHYIILIQKQQS